MEVGDELIHYLKLVSGADEDVRPAPERTDFAQRRGHAFQGAGGGRAHGDHGSSFGLGPGHGLRRTLGHFCVLRVHDMLADVIHAHRAECAVPDVEGDLGQADAPLFKPVHDLRGEVQPGRGCCHGPELVFPRVHGLVAGVVLGLVLTVDVRGQGDVSLAQKMPGQVAVPAHFDPGAAKFAFFQDAQLKAMKKEAIALARPFEALSSPSAMAIRRPSGPV